MCAESAAGVGYANTAMGASPHDGSRLFSRSMSCTTSTESRPSSMKPVCIAARALLALLSGPRDADSCSAVSSSAAPPTQYSINTPCPSFAVSSGRYPTTSPRIRAPAFRWKRSPRSLPFSTYSANNCSPSPVHSRQRVTPHTLCAPASCAWRSTKESSTPPRLPALGSATTPNSCVTAPRGVCSVASVRRTALRSTWMAEDSGNRRLGPGATEHRCSLSMASVRALLSGPESSLGQAVVLSSGGWLLRAGTLGPCCSTSKEATRCVYMAASSVPLPPKATNWPLGSSSSRCRSVASDERRNSESHCASSSSSCGRSESVASRKPAHGAGTRRCSVMRVYGEPFG
eukprot:scaffold27061_cov78-Phaeocystis_antarctica.AAC.2